MSDSHLYWRAIRKQNLLKKLKEKPSIDSNDSVPKRILNIKSRNLIITSKFINKTIDVYNGRAFFCVVVKEEMIGHKFGEFALTRRHSPPRKKNVKRTVRFRKKS